MTIHNFVKELHTRREVRRMEVDPGRSRRFWTGLAHRKFRGNPRCELPILRPVCRSGWIGNSNPAGSGAIQCLVKKDLFVRGTRRPWFMHPYFVPDVLQGNVMVEADVLTAAIQILLWSKQNGCDACAQAVADVRRSAFCVPLRLPRLKGCVELVLH